VFTASFRVVRCRRRRHRVSVLELSEFKKTLIWKVYNMLSCYHVSSVTPRMVQGHPSSSLVPFGVRIGPPSSKLPDHGTAVSMKCGSQYVAVRYSLVRPRHRAATTIDRDVAKWGNVGVVDCDTVRIIIPTYSSDVLPFNPVAFTSARILHQMEQGCLMGGLAPCEG